ncbi:phosphate transport system regulatory protein PhoU [Alicyclobacillaceae bacterium I2511]|nr:phosphate transport system regulatory protein PhoU [Alicyclobacillaceae bacterium I2511]
MQQRQNFDISLRELKLQLLHMGGDVQESIRKAIEALKIGDMVMAGQVVHDDIHINQQEHEIENLCIRLIATQQPVATDLRKIVAGMQIATDLERMGDNAVDIAKTVTRLQGQTLIKPLVDIPQMATIVDTMISNALNAYVENSLDLAEDLAIQDDEVDHLYRRMMEELFSIGKDRPDVAHQAMSLAFIGRYLERIGDHATNVGEGVIFIITGKRSDLN